MYCERLYVELFRTNERTSASRIYNDLERSEKNDDPDLEEKALENFKFDIEKKCFDNFEI